MDFIAITDIKAPYVVATGMPHKPSQIKTIRFKKGQIISGELKKEQGIVLHKGVVPIPITSLKKVVTQNISTVPTTSTETTSSSADGTTIKVEDKKIKILTPEDKKKKYLDGVILGGLIGFGAVYYAEKKGYIAVPEQQNKIIGAVVGALAGAYVVYRFVLDKK